MAENHHILDSGSFRVKISDHGAELKSISDKSGLEYLWQAGEAWQRRAPVLFPIVGKLKNDQYFFEGKSYKLSQHGFARDKTFTFIGGSRSAAEYLLVADDQTKEAYPFDFELRIVYELQDNELQVKYHVANPGKKNLLFSVGAHPAFRCPLLPDETFTDYILKFEQYSFLQTALREGLRASERKLVPLDEKTLPLTTTLFDHDALVFENSQVNEVSLISQKSGHGVSLFSQGWPYFGIWSKKGTHEFVCLEPWYGIADHSESSQQLHHKDGIINLPPAQTFSAMFVLKFF